MASLRDIRDRITSVKNTQQLTRAMKMVAASKLRKAQEGIFSTRPYSYKIKEIIGELRSSVDPTSHPLFLEKEGVEGVLLIIVTADRGLAGAFNSNIIRLAEITIEEKYKDLHEKGLLSLVCMGKKGHEHFERRGYNIIGDYRGAFNKLTFKTADDIVDIAVNGFMEDKWDQVFVIYNEFKNTISQNKIIQPFLPIPKGDFMTPVMEASENYIGVSEHETEQDYIFEPDAETILNRLIPRYLNFDFWRVLLESNASEQGARMVAMDNATTNAGELLGELKLTYNQARQAAITTEILEIVSGAEALSKG